MPDAAQALHHVRRWFTEPFPPSKIFAALLTLGALIAVALWPVLKEKQNWHEPKEWLLAVGANWLALLAAIYLKFSDSLSKRNKKSKERVRYFIERKLMTARAINELHGHITENRFGPEILNVRECVLEAAAHSLSDFLTLPLGDRLSIALMDFPADKPDKMRVVARSSKENAPGTQYQKNKLVAWEAVEKARWVHVPDVRLDFRFDKTSERRYVSVFAVPVTRNGRAYAALSIDHEKAYIFYGRERLIATHLEPYLALLALTYKDADVNLECGYRSPHT